MNRINNTNIKQIDILTAPEQLKNEHPVSPVIKENIFQHREAIKNILEGKDDRLVVICGPCSIHDLESAKEYALKLKTLHDQFKDKLLIVMRVYFEKPRTHVGWKGMISDPNLDGSNDMNKGLRRARSLLLWLAKLGLPVATEALDPISPQYISDLISWVAIGARTTESQTHREMASGLSMPVGFKNTTDGSLDIAINAIISASSPHSFIGIDNSGRTALLHTTGNKLAHIILRGGKTPNYKKVSVKECEQQLSAANIDSIASAKIIIDCSHGNSNKDYRKQSLVLEDIIKQKSQGNSSIIGVMLESHLVAGNQKISEDMRYGQSITDSCIDWQTTEALLNKAHQKLSQSYN